MTNSQLFPDALIRRILAPFGVTTTPDLSRAIAGYGELLVKWNSKVNLTSITDPKEILTRHFGESLFAARLIRDEPGLLVDIGSGAGFPGLALKLVRPNLRLLLLEPVKKKAAFLSEAVRVLGSKQVSIETSRTSDLPAEGIRADYITARAVGHFPDLLTWSAGAMGEGGQLLLWLGLSDVLAITLRHEWNWTPPKPIPCSQSGVLLQGTKK